jgi:hypothetical protein
MLSSAPALKVNPNPRRSPTFKTKKVFLNMLFLVGWGQAQCWGEVN